MYPGELSSRQSALSMRAHSSGKSPAYEKESSLNQVSARPHGVSPRRDRPYTIRKGDTLESIAQKRGLKVSDLEKYNKGLSEKGVRTATGSLQEMALGAERIDV